MCCLLAFCSVTPDPAMIRAVCEYNRLILITVIIFVLLRFLSETPKLYFEKAIGLSREILMFLAAI